MLKPAATVLLIIAAATPCTALRSSQPIKNWEFSKDSVSWKNVDVPHDWAIYGPFSRDNDLQKVTVEQNGETEATWKTGRTGGLPYMGKGFYKTEVEVPDTTGKTFTLEFDRAMSNPVVYVTVRAVDKDGNFVPTDSREVKFTVKGAGRFRAAANGDPKGLRLFHEPVTDLFSGAATAIVQAGDRPGEIFFEARAKGLAPARLTLTAE